jgi:hypothetical protein
MGLRYPVLGLIFTIEMVAISLLRFSKRLHPVRHGNLAMLGFEPNFSFYLLDKALAANRDRQRSFSARVEARGQRMSCKMR